MIVLAIDYATFIATYKCGNLVMVVQEDPEFVMQNALKVGDVI